MKNELLAFIPSRSWKHENRALSICRNALRRIWKNIISEFVESRSPKRENEPLEFVETPSWDAKTMLFEFLQIRM